MPDLANKVAVVTGAGRGIGKAIAIAYAKNGAKVCCLARKSNEIDETVKIIKMNGGKAISLTCDVSKYNELIPGPVVTNMGNDSMKDNNSVFSISSEWIKTPEDVTNLALFLANQPLVGPTGQSFSLMRRDL